MWKLSAVTIFHEENKSSQHSKKVAYVPYFEILRNMATGHQKYRTGKMGAEESQDMYRRAILSCT